jgi:hypothetical protein
MVVADEPSRPPTVYAQVLGQPAAAPHGARDTNPLVALAVASQIGAPVPAAVTTRMGCTICTTLHVSVITPVLLWLEALVAVPVPVLVECSPVSPRCSAASSDPPPSRGFVPSVRTPPPQPKAPAASAIEAHGRTTEGRKGKKRRAKKVIARR